MAKKVGRPKKNPNEKSRLAAKIIYFPISDDYNLIWNEFDLLCKKIQHPTLYNRNIHFKKGVMIRRMIMNWVFQNSKNEVVLKLLQEKIEEENIGRIKKWEADTGKKYKDDVMGED